MKQAWITGAGLAALLALGACSQTISLEQPAPSAPLQATAAPAEVSPRGECSDAHVTLYFGEQVQSDEPVVTPLLNDFMTRIRGCEAAGGELRTITITTVADPDQGAADGRAQVRRRLDRVRAALVNHGAPADKIRDGEAGSAQQIMGRRAEITADLY
jgi:hypothetical protein